MIDFRVGPAADGRRGVAQNKREEVSEGIHALRNGSRRIPGRPASRPEWRGTPANDRHHPFERKRIGNDE